MSKANFYEMIIFFLLKDIRKWVGLCIIVLPKGHIDRANQKNYFKTKIQNLTIENYLTWFYFIT